MSVRRFQRGFRSTSYGYTGESLVDALVTQAKSSGDSGYYSDTGGYGWYFNGKNLTIDMVFAPGGGPRVTFAQTDPKWAGIFAKVVSGKSPVTKVNAAAIAARAGGQETSGRAIAASSMQGASIAASVPVVGGSLPTAEGGSWLEKLSSGGFGGPYVLPVIGGAVLVGVIAIAFWPEPKK